ncbi:uncharacterized protein LOC18445849 [Amborella trichopoda]|uniref:GYF domain-containing protein n=1 Tax=Amborella trichopoda TaxID=13333 RepID=U5D4Z2_AMBTC|nr:uncharacterized protein LOC18445849 [Amborella trichopoda]XP_020530391.1 uncharacterized protein LOC18445849 [Amborella trichopoda]ERN17504.1 hypothetical protein AMTR_s00059p00074580 [Amborella trichopoda]|eukprot:XP_006856037.1 uncharacterized protein LOC18445849 [Amborella trichopoda]
MAERSNADAHSNASQQSLPKDTMGAETAIPLSPQWLLPKPGESKSGSALGDSHMSPHPGYSNRPDFLNKSSGGGEEHLDTERKRDVWRSPMNDSETIRRDRWRDEERESNSALRRDRWRDGGEKENPETRRMERWTENSLVKASGEARRAPSERWGDSGNKETNFEQRRESKWNPRWGPDDKDSDNRRDKWVDSGRDGEVSRDKGMLPMVNHAKESDRDGEHHPRSWRSSNSLQIRGRVEPSNMPPPNPVKQSSIYGFGRGRGDHLSSSFSVGRGRVSSTGNMSANSYSNSGSLGVSFDKSEVGHGDALNLRYNRTKLLDIYRLVDVKSVSTKLIDGLKEVPSLTQTEPLEPLALLAPTPEEEIVLTGIDKGDIVSSLPPQVPKDVSVGRSTLTTDVAQSRRSKHGSREDFSLIGDDFKEESSNVFKVNDINSESQTGNQRYSTGPDPNVDPRYYREFDSNAEATRNEGHNKDTSSHESAFQQTGTPWRSQSVGDRTRGSLSDWRDYSTEGKSKTTDMRWPPSMKDKDIEHESDRFVSPSRFNDELDQQLRDGYHSEMGRNSELRRQASDVLDRRRETNLMTGKEETSASSARDMVTGRNLQLQVPPEELSLYYKDPQGEIQGPFPGSDLIGWFEAGYFGIDLQVRHVNASPDTPFSSLGDVMPHLKMKARPPPGFGAAKPNESPEITNATKFGGSGKLSAGSSEVDLLNNELRRQKSATETENRFFESLMSTNLSSSPLEGSQEYLGNSIGGMQSMGLGSGLDASHRLAQKMSAERQRSLPTSFPYWPGRDAPSIVTQSEMMPGPSSPNPKLNAPLHMPPHSPQQVDIMSILQGAVDNASPINNRVNSWSNFPDARSLNNTLNNGMDICQDKIDTHHMQQRFAQAGFGFQQPRLQPQHPPPLSNIISSPGDHTSGMDQLLSLGLPQDPHSLNILQQQLLLSQMQISSQQAPVSSQLSLLDKLLFLQRQKQEQQQKLLLQQTQEQLLSQVLLERQSQQHFGEPPYGNLQVGGVSTGDTSMDHRMSHPMNEPFHMNTQMPQSLPNEEKMVNNLESSPLHLPHQFFEANASSKGWELPVPHHSESMPESSHEDHSSHMINSINSELLEQSKHQSMVPQDLVQALDGGRGLAQPSQEDHTNKAAKSEADFSEDNNTLSRTDKNCNIKAFIPDEPEFQGEQDIMESEIVKEVKNVEVRDVKKAEKKARKAKNSKSVSSSDVGKVASESPVKQGVGHERLILKENKAGVPVEMEEKNHGALPVAIGDTESGASFEPLDLQTARPKAFQGDGKDESREVESVAKDNVQTSTGHRAWKAAPGFRPKSLIEIQQEEQQRAEKEVVVSEVSVPVHPVPSTPWSGVVSNQLPKPSNQQDAIPLGNSTSIANPKNRKSQLHDLLAEEVLAKTSEKFVGDPATPSFEKDLFPPLEVDTPNADNDDFVEAKDTKKGRKRAAKLKNTGVKAASPAIPVESSVASSPIEKGKSSRQIQQEKEVLPLPPSGPSLGDFVLWKGEPSPAPAPAWSTDLGKQSKPTSLREIQKQQEKKLPPIQNQSQIPIPPKAQSSRASKGNGSSWQLSGSSPSKAAAPIPISSVSSAYSRSKTEDDLFWGPLDQSKPEPKQSEFPSLGGTNSWSSKTIPVKGTSGVTLNRQKSSGNKASDYFLSSSPASSSAQSASKGRKSSMTKQQEAMDFRNWCESEAMRLMGSKDTSFLEFCLKQSTSEAETLLVENLGSLDPDGDFIDKFLKYKELLHSDVIELSFGNRTDLCSKDNTEDVHNINPSSRGGGDGEQDKGSKKKGKKGKKVSPSVLGFNVVSNRIMKGEIQTLED